MTKIKELPAILADQIAAGEVVERPASVVKELVENAIDAGSTQISITVKEAGLALIQVTDNGQGIIADEVKLAFRRHSTSKLTDRHDLFRIKTLGFRGEALPSIASVAEVVLATAAVDGQGTQVSIRGGKVLEQKMIARPQGTQVQVKALFFNTPARLKYLKSPQTELAVISDIVNRLSLSHPEIAFTFKNNERVLLETAGNRNLRQTISAIYGIKNARQMLEIKNESLDFKVSGFVSLPKLTRATKNYISLLLNGRYIRNYQLTNAVIKGYGSKLMVGRYPIAVIQLELDPVLVDVNVHPTKQEVRISKEDQLSQLITQTIYDRIYQENLIPEALDNLSSNKRQSLDFKQLNNRLNESSQPYQHVLPNTEATVKKTENFAQAVPKADEKEVASNAQPEVYIIKQRNELAQKLNTWDQKYVRITKPKSETLSKSESLSNISEKLSASQMRFPTLNYLGQLHGTYLLAEADNGFYLIDQHAAQERCKYEKFRVTIGNVAAAQQELLVPLVLDYPTSDALLIRANLDKLAAVDIQLEDFGQNSFIVHRHPTWFEAGKEESIIRELIDALLRDGKISITAFREQTAIMMSCKLSIKANHHLDDQQAKALLEQLAKCENPFNCPHGRPTLVHFSNKDLEKMFKRIQDSHQSLKDQ
ncbi:DNA mismatch repair endonuclease MutL [Liquorilactobacillus nagelii]|uniref:DNA mismatch repair endonuclease MutL n=1 Tax=Liquorilactobacillus nagelii TaxID=82688 RepID=UPI0039EB5ED7